MTPRMANALRDAVVATREAYDDEDKVQDALEACEFAQVVLDEHKALHERPMPFNEEELAHTIISEMLTMVVDF